MISSIGIRQFEKEAGILDLGRLAFRGLNRGAKQVWAGNMGGRAAFQNYRNMMGRAFQHQTPWLYNNYRRIGNWMRRAGAPAAAVAATEAVPTGPAQQVM